MRLLEALSYGTERYPRKVARRLRVLNITCWSTALVWLGFAAFYLPDFKLRTVVLIDMGMAVLLFGVPLLHRIGPKAAAMTFVFVSYPGVFVVCYLVGTDSGMQMEYLAFAAGAVLVLGVEPLAPPLIVGIFALALILALEIFAPHNSGLLDETAMLGGFIAVVTATMTVMFAVRFGSRFSLQARPRNGRGGRIRPFVAPAVNDWIGALQTFLVSCGNVHRAENTYFGRARFHGVCVLPWTSTWHASTPAWRRRQWHQPATCGKL
jgi:MASE7